ncbi:hypothetical protein [Burkholderia multivorans]|uniref:hypothetical protein n=1 Tax=Burkholderia multivorans TaxID=87883 RepID=UPI0021BE24F5|nr:hypothetical protein [Burkholderia multivorans]MDR9053453.1 hypothetical protein [Burkholderia multivorans]MDR9059253.1 hypothetical protein [Burkholderia multivorans]MDR9066479.1 hypothetical protein [Burkholderia multivorans]MDR9071063.1 hypothetical protein [Burkholderia multivorans]MDR9076671.1 hypothetical protein [Burkholderia multivorans]
MSAVRLPFAAEDAGRAVFRRDKGGPDWGALVERILGPVVTEADRERRRADALALAAAAMRAAGEPNPASQADGSTNV